MLRAGDRVRVKSASEILATLDNHASYEDVPFMPQMLAYCGKTFRISKSAHKLCDTVNGTGGRRLTNTVFLDDLRCDGQVFGNCEMECLIFWKEAWLSRVDDAAAAQPTAPDDAGMASLSALVHRCVQPPDRQAPGSAPVYQCQATRMPEATTWLSVWDLRQYVEDLRTGNATAREVASALAFLVYHTLATSGLGLGSLLRAAYDVVQKFRGGHTYPARPGKLPRNSRTPSVSLGVEEGELVRVKTHQQGLETVTEDLVNRGMGFHAEMAPYCGQTFRVGKRLRRIMNEKTGQVMDLKNQCLVLEGVPCKGHYTKPLLCPRGMYPYWREIWLERESGPVGETDCG